MFFADGCKNVNAIFNNFVCSASHMFAVHPICAQDSIFKMFSSSPEDHVVTVPGHSIRVCVCIVNCLLFPKGHLVEISLDQEGCSNKLWHLFLTHLFSEEEDDNCRCFDRDILLEWCLKVRSHCVRVRISFSVRFSFRVRRTVYIESEFLSVFDLILCPQLPRQTSKCDFV